MKKIKQILSFILALLNFLFHFKPIPDDENSVINPPPLPDHPEDREAWN